MKDRIVSERYAQALLDIAEDNADKMLLDLQSVKEVIDANISLKKYLWSPQVDDNGKKLLLKKLFGEQIDVMVLNFIALLLRKGRVTILLDIIDSFEDLYSEKMNINRITVVSAVPLKKSLTGRLVSKLEEVSGKSIKLHFDVDDSIIGGIILRTPSKELDGSVRRQLLNLKKMLTEVKV